MKPVKSVSFIMTERCTASCVICCNACSPQKTRMLDDETIRHYMREAKETLPALESFSFTGGEPFIDSERLYELIRYAYEELRITSSVVSNGYWGINYEKGSEIISRMKQAGLREVRLSADHFHQEYVPAEAVKGAIRILAEQKLKSEVTIMVIKGKEGFAETVRALRPEIYMTECVCYPLLLTEKVRKNPAIPYTDEDIIGQYRPGDCFCSHLTEGALHFCYDGYVYNCCSQDSFDIPQMRIGKIGEDSIQDMLYFKHHDPLLEIIYRKGVAWLARRASEMGFPIKEVYSSPCELCHDLIKNQAFMEAVMPAVREEVKKLRAESLLSNLFK